MWREAVLFSAGVTMLAAGGVRSSLWSQSAARFALSGTVLDATTDEPLPGVNVFLANTMLGSATTDDGAFEIRAVPAGTYDLVVSMIGYETQRRRLVISGPLRHPLMFRLQPRVLEAPEIEITAELDRIWQKNYREFCELFFSTTRNADSCRILNPEVLDFSRDADRFQAVARKPLILENRALGYRIHYLMDFFESDANMIRISRTPRYEALEPRTAAEQVFWKRNRRRTYLGSLRHFLRTVYLNYVRTGGAVEARDGGEPDLVAEEGFVVYYVDGPFSVNPNRKRELAQTNRFVTLSSRPYEWQLYFPDYLEVTYLLEKEEDNFLAYFHEYRKPREQKSYITVHDHVVTVDTTGHVYDQAGIQAFGYWGWEREADKLPRDYTDPGGDFRIGWREN